MNVLIACEFSGTVRDAFIRRGHLAVSCDILPSTRQPHLQMDALQAVLAAPWDLLIAHPPCTYLANSGVRWLTPHNTDRWLALAQGAEFFRALLNAPIRRVAVENPIMHGYGKTLIGEAQTQVIQPWQFGHGETKATCLWLKNLPPLQPTNIVEGREARVHKLPPSADRWALRSITYQGIADAMADQWGK